MGQVQNTSKIKLSTPVSSVSQPPPVEQPKSSQPPLKRLPSFHSSKLLLPDDQLSSKIEHSSAPKLEKTFQSLQKHLKRQSGQLDLFQNILKCQDDQGQNRYQSIVRDSKELERSGILKDLQQIEAPGPDSNQSELFRSIEDDARWVLNDFKKLTPDQIGELKEKAYQHPEVERDLAESVKMKHYGSDKHKQYGKLVEQLTGGIISAEEAMAMNPTGGLPGPGATEIPLIGRIGAVARHAMRHDACGFLLTRFNVGPGYGTETTPLGLDKSNPLAGQWLGIAREAFVEESIFEDSSGVATPHRFV